MKLPRITAHAGCEDTRANTIESIQKAIESEADIVEVDVRTTCDDVFVLSHDDSIAYERGMMTISKSTYDELKANVEGIVTLEEALRLIKLNKREINMDIKDVHDYDALHEIVRSQEMIDQAVITGCHIEAVQEINRILGHIRTYLSADDYFVKNHPDRYEEFIRETCKSALDNGCYGINLHYVDCKPELIEYTHEHGLPICVWTVDDEDVMKKYVELGVDGITTNKVQVLSNVLKK